MQAFAHVDPRKLAPAMKLAGGIRDARRARFGWRADQFGLAVPLGLTGWDCSAGCRSARRGFFAHPESDGQGRAVRSPS